MDGVPDFADLHKDGLLAEGVDVLAFAEPHTAGGETPRKRPKPRIHVQAGGLPEQVEEAAAVLCKSGLPIYDFGGVLVMVQRRKRAGSAAAVPVRGVAVAPARMRLELARVAEWTKTVKVFGELQDVRMNPPKEVAEALLSGGDFGFQPLTRIVTTPFLLPEGELVSVPGYHEASGILFDPCGVTFPAIPAVPTRADALAALDVLQDFLCDFPFADESARAAALSAILTATLRSAIAGPVPLYLFHAHVAGTGKGKAVNVVGIIATGAPVPCMASVEEVEFEKRIAAALVGGQSLLLIDNVSGKLGNATLDALITTEGEWYGRILGRTEPVSLPAQVVVFATGNNVKIGGDLARRCVPVFLESKVERPEHRSGFRHANLLAHVKAKRPEAVAACLTIALAYRAAGAPDVGVRGLGSFEAWSAAVCAPLVWLGCADPMQGQEALREDADEGVTAWRDALAALGQRFGGESFTAASVAREIAQVGAALYPARELFAALVRGSDVTNATGQNLAAVFKRRRGQIAGGLALQKSAELRGNDGFKWRIETCDAASVAV